MANISSERVELYKQLDEVIAKWKDEQGGLIPIMQSAQRTIGCLDEEVQTYIADALNIPVTKVYGVATFYSFFTLEAKGKYTINMCLGTACYVRGAQGVFDELCKELNVQPGRTTSDGLFTLDAMRCIGCCGLAPAMMINDDVYGKMTPEKVHDIIEKYRN
ncbi:MAG: NADH-quinone oxidoreductase subunit NuoE [Clostridia bacterium]|nr:NADH-quinone oxidoreductase subunit NuoE [Clostridia bacterium]